jgi:hypothetical protein
MDGMAAGQPLAGCWFSSVKQGIDIVDGMDSLQFCNSRTILSVLAGYPAERRIRGGHQEHIIRAACPAWKRQTARTHLRRLGFRGTRRLLLDVRK